MLHSEQKQALRRHRTVPGSPVRSGVQVTVVWRFMLSSVRMEFFQVLRFPPTNQQNMQVGEWVQGMCERCPVTTRRPIWGGFQSRIKGFWNKTQFAAMQCKNMTNKKKTGKHHGQRRDKYNEICFDYFSFAKNVLNT